MILGIFIGVIIGVTLMCIVQINKENKYYELVSAINSLSVYISIRVNQAKRLEKENVSGMKEIQKIFDYYFKEEISGNKQF